MYFNVEFGFYFFLLLSWFHSDNRDTLSTLFSDAEEKEVFLCVFFFKYIYVYLYMCIK